MRLFETHAHLDLPDYDPDREALIEECFGSGIEYIINIGFNKETSLNSLELAKKHLHIFATAGFHPHDAMDFDAELVKRLAREKNVLAIGEIGLDFFRHLSPYTVQREVFRNQVLLALDYDLPIVVHNREAHQECYKILKQANAKNVVFHCFSGDIIFAQQVLDEGWHISFTGSVTYANANLDDVIRMMPLDQFMIETDCPYLPPHPHRGERNSPLHLHLVAEKIAAIREITPEEVAEHSFENAFKFFRIPPDPVKPPHKGGKSSKEPKPGKSATAKPAKSTPIKPVEKTPVKPVEKAPAKQVKSASVKLVEKTTVKTVEKAPAKPDVKVPAKQVKSAPAKQVKTALPKPVKSTPAKGVKSAPAKPVKSTPTKAVKNAPAKQTKTAPTKPVKKVPAKPVKSTPTKAVKNTPAKQTKTAPTKPVKKTTAKPMKSVPAKQAKSVPAKPVKKAPAKPVKSAPAKNSKTKPEKRKK
ncbi:MAG TPA: YchF/TatD family DNA exonuclease [Candidatus Syntrophosphaera sp.]|nr:YchF/TatD family DNA exonuclease [Candidatus Syntrophosphaera sp.]